MSWHAESICCATMSHVPDNISHFTDYFELSLLCSYTRSIPSWRSYTRIYLGKTSWCVHKQNSELSLTSISRSTLFFLSLAGHYDPTNNLMYFCLDYTVLLYFVFILFPWCVSYGLARATGSWLLTPAGGEGEDRMRWLDDYTDTMDMSLSKF